MIERVFQLALEAKHGMYPGQKDDLICWIMEQIDEISAAGLDVTQAQEQLHARYQILIAQNQPSYQVRDPQ